MTPPAFFAATLLALFGMATVLPGPALVSGGWRAAGLLSVLGGIVMHRAAWRRFRASRTPIPAGETPRVLVTGGPYRWTRNPMYLAGVLILLGLAVLVGSGTAFAPLLLWVWVTDRRFLAAEERALQNRFGSAYEEYRNRVRRWL